jgi:hypothetical protein
MNRHLTEAQICRAVAGQSTLDEQGHANGCPACAAEIARSRQLFGAFRHEMRARAENDALQVTASFQAPAFVSWRPAWAFTAAVLMVVAGAWLWQVQSTRPAGPAHPGDSRPIGSGGSDETTDWPVDAANEFFPLDYSTVPVTSGRIVRIEVPRAASVAFGLDPVHLVSARGDSVLADVVVGEDGLARAVRFVRHVAHASKE